MTGYKEHWWVPDAKMAVKPESRIRMSKPSTLSWGSKHQGPGVGGTAEGPPPQRVSGRFLVLVMLFPGV